MREWHKSLSGSMASGRLTLIALDCRSPWLLSCERSRAEVARASSNSPDFDRVYRPARSARSAKPSCRVTRSCCLTCESSSSTSRDRVRQYRGARGRHGRSGSRAGRNRIHGLQRPFARVGSAASRHPRRCRPELLDRSSARRAAIACALDRRLGGLRVGVGPAGTGSAVTSELLLSPYVARCAPDRGVARRANRRHAARRRARCGLHDFRHSTRRGGACDADGARLVPSTGRRWIGSAARIHFFDRP